MKDKAQWRIARVTDYIKGNDNVVRGLKLKLGNRYIIERPLTLVCKLEIEKKCQMCLKKEQIRKRNSIQCKGVCTRRRI